MVTYIAGMLSKFNVSRLVIDDFSVRTAPAATGCDEFPAVLMASRAVAERMVCPFCHFDEAVYVSGDDIVTVLCRECWSIYRFKDANNNNSCLGGGKDA